MIYSISNAFLASCCWPKLFILVGDSVVVFVSSTKSISRRSTWSRDADRALPGVRDWWTVRQWWWARSGNEHSSTVQLSCRLSGCPVLSLSPRCPERYDELGLLCRFSLRGWRLSSSTAQTQSTDSVTTQYGSRPFRFALLPVRAHTLLGARAGVALGSSVSRVFFRHDRSARIE